MGKGKRLNRIKKTSRPEPSPDGFKFRIKYEYSKKHQTFLYRYWTTIMDHANAGKNATEVFRSELVVVTKCHNTYGTCDASLWVYANTKDHHMPVEMYGIMVMEDF